MRDAQDVAEIVEERSVALMVIIESLSAPIFLKHQNQVDSLGRTSTRSLCLL